MQKLTIDGEPDSLNERELLAQWLGMFEGGIASSPLSALRELTRSLLNKPAKLPMIDAHNERLIASLRNRVTELEAAQPQGEPVAWQHRVTAGSQTGWSLWAPGRGKEYAEHYTVEVRPLYAERPAPVAVGTVKMHGDMKCIAFGDAEWKALNVGDIIFTAGAKV